MWFDESVVDSVAGGLPVWAAILLVLVSYLGSVYLLVPTAVYVYLRGSDSRTATWPAVLLGAYALFVALKPLSDVPRPAERGVESPLAGESLPVVLDTLHGSAVGFTTGSFPSGHAIAITVFWGLVVADLGVGTRRGRLAVAAVWVPAVLFSRLALGTHYVGDIVGGVVIATLFLAVAFALRRVLECTPWRGLGPVEGLVVLAAVPALAAVPLGRPVDGAILLGALAGTVFVHRWTSLRGIDLPP